MNKQLNMDVELELNFDITDLDIIENEFTYYNGEIYEYMPICDLDELDDLILI